MKRTLLRITSMVTIRIKLIRGQTKALTFAKCRPLDQKNRK